jgi:hypothetical protein
VAEHHAEGVDEGDSRPRPPAGRRGQVGGHVTASISCLGAGNQRETRVRMRRPFVDGGRIAVEWWATMLDKGEEVTLPGCLLLRFQADGRFGASGDLARRKLLPALSRERASHAKYRRALSAAARAKRKRSA